MCQRVNAMTLRGEKAFLFCFVSIFLFRVLTSLLFASWLLFSCSSFFNNLPILPSYLFFSVYFSFISSFYSLPSSPSSPLQACGSGSPCPSETAEPSPEQASPEAGSQIAAGQGRYKCPSLNISPSLSTCHLHFSCFLLLQLQLTSFSCLVTSLIFFYFSSPFVKSVNVLSCV